MISKDIEFILSIASTSQAQEKILKEYWPDAITFILSTKNNKMAFRVPKDESLTRLLELYGPLISTSCNIHGKPIAGTWEEAGNIFGNDVDFYISSDRKDSSPSTLIDLTQEPFKILRQGQILFKV